MYIKYLHLIVCPFHKVVEKSEKNGNAPNDLRLILNPYQSKIPCLYYMPSSDEQMSVRFALRPAIFKTQSC